MPVAWHCVAVCIELRLNVSQTLEGLAGRWFHFKLQLRRRPIDVQNMRLTGIPNSKSGHRNDTKRYTNGYQPGKKPKSSCAAPIKREKDEAWRDDARHNERDRRGKITGLTFKRRDMKGGCERRAQSEAEKQSAPDADNPRDNSEENCANGKFSCRGLNEMIRANLPEQGFGGGRFADAFSRSLR